MNKKMTWNQFARYFIDKDTRLAVNYRVFSLPAMISVAVAVVYNVRYYIWFFTN